MTPARDWAGRVGDVWADEWRRTDRSFATLAAHLDAEILLAAPEQGRGLDIGCGAGTTALSLARARPALRLLGVDLSAELIAVARTRLAPGSQTAAQGAAPPDRPEPGQPMFEVADAPAVAATRGPFDLLVSRHGVMFFADPVAAFAALRRSAVPGAALVFSCFAERSANRFATLADELAGTAPASALAPGPFAFADPAHVGGILRASGWQPDAPQRIAFSYRVGAGIDPVADGVFFLSRIGPLASALAGSPGAHALRLALADELAHYRTGDVVDLPATAWIWRARTACHE